MSQTVKTACFDKLDPNTPDWVHLVPIGEINGRDGRSFTLNDPEAIVAKFKAQRIDLPVDYEHQIQKTANNAVGPIPAAGWIKDLKIEETGIWGQVEWTAMARDLLAAKAYRYLSPVLNHQKGSTVVTGLSGAGLVHRPNLELTALASQEDNMPETNPLFQRLLDVLNLPEDTTEAALIAKIALQASHAAKSKEAAREHTKEMAQAHATTTGEIPSNTQPNPAEFVPFAAMQEMMAAQAQEVSLMREERARAKVNKAASEGYFTGPGYEWAMKLALQDEEKFDEFLNTQIPLVDIKNQKSLGLHPRAQIVARTGDPDVAAVCRQLGLPDGSLSSES